MSLIHAKGNGGTYPYFFCIGRMPRNGCQQPYLHTETIERAVEHLYARVAPSAEHIEAVRAKLDQTLSGMRTQARQETARQERRLAKLADERTKLLHAYYQGAIPIDLLHQEQGRIAPMEPSPLPAIGRPRREHRARRHRRAIRHTDRARRPPNSQRPHGLQQPQPPRGGARTTTAADNGHGSNKGQTVGAAGFEPATPCSQSRCATRLRHAPMRAQF
jgi:hypothetical protein